MTSPRISSVSSTLETMEAGRPEVREQTMRCPGPEPIAQAKPQQGHRLGLVLTHSTPLQGLGTYNAKCPQSSRAQSLGFSIACRVRNPEP